MVQDAESMKETDQIKKDTVSAKNDAETLGYQVEKQLSDLKDKMSTADAEELKKKLEDLRACSASEDADLDQLKKATSELQEKSWAITQAAYSSSSNEEGAEKKEGADANNNEEKKDEKEKK